MPAGKGLPGSHAAVDVEGLTGDEAGLLQGKKFHGISDIVRSAPATDGDLGEVAFFVFGWVVRVAFDGNPAGSDHVHSNAVGGEFASHGPGPTDLSAFGRDISGKIGDGSGINLGSDIDDASPLSFLHAGESGLGEKEGANDEEIEHGAVGFFVVLLDGKLGLGRSGVGDDDVDGSQFVSSLFEKAANFGFFGNIGTNGDGSSSFGDDFPGDFLAPSNVIEGVDDDFCSGVGEGAGDSRAEAFAASCDEGDVAGE